MVVAFLVTVVALILLAAVVVPNGSLGPYERHRRMKEGRKDDREVERELYHGDIVSLLYVLRSLLVVVMTILAALGFGWFFGSVIALLIALEYGAAARLAWPRRFMAARYQTVEPKLFALASRYPKVFSLIRIFTPETPETVLHSRDELVHLVESSGRLLDEDEKKLITNSLSFSDMLIRDIMTPRTVIEAVDKKELLGPLVLDDLHKKGHSRFPVIDGDIDHIVGVLHLRDVLAVDTATKRTAKVESAMEAKILYIHEDQSLSHALDAFLKTHHHLFIVVNEYRETVGLLTLEDVIEALLGRRIVDEFDAHDDLRAVAARNPRANNSERTSHDV